MIHYDTTDDHHQYPRQNDQTRKEKKFEFGNRIPVRRTERFIYINKYKSKKSCKQDQTNQVRFLVHENRYFTIQQSHFSMFLNKDTLFFFRIFTTHK